MTHFEDLSKYTYSKDNRRALNVGWLGEGHSFPIGHVESEIFDSLLELVDSPMNIMRGLHNCEFCDADSPVTVLSTSGERKVRVGVGEIRVRGRDRIAFAAPTLIVHYIDAHNYLPPQRFLDAVRDTSTNSSASSHVRAWWGI